jgi:hypothetical protein
MAGVVVPHVLKVQGGHKQSTCTKTLDQYQLSMRQSTVHASADRSELITCTVHRPQVLHVHSHSHCTPTRVEGLFRRMAPIRQVLLIELMS